MVIHIINLVRKTSSNFTIFNKVYGNFSGNNSNATFEVTMITKPDYPYFFTTTIVINETNDKTNDTEGLNTYNQILNTFKIGQK